MMYGWWDGSAGPWQGMFFGPIMMIIFVVLTVLIIAWVVRALGRGSQSDAAAATPLDTLKQRFARGEIDRAEFDERRKILTSS